MADYLAKLPDLARVHMVAASDTIKLVLEGVNIIAAVHQKLCRERIKLEAQKNVASLECQTEWNVHCLSQLEPLIPSLTDAVIAMRCELGLPVDAATYKTIVKELSEQANNQAAGFFGHLLNRDEYTAAKKVG